MSESRFEGIVEGPHERLGKEHLERRNSKCKDPEAGGGRHGWSGVMEGMGSRGWVRQLKEVRPMGLGGPPQRRRFCKSCWRAPTRGGTGFVLGFNRIPLAFG